MVAKAFVIVNVEVGRETKILEELREMKRVKEAHIVYGAYDMIAIIEAPTVQAVKDIINSEIRRLEGVNVTLIMIVV